MPKTKDNPLSASFECDAKRNIFFIQADKIINKLMTLFNEMTYENNITKILLIKNQQKANIQKVAVNQWQLYFVFHN